ncbi:MAG: glycine cleavage system protein GcvH [Candidatus Omnitrophota bacterium]|nr:glycine cleavage system protein GcvH [Candidatus Omnitrophota bacterium]
MSGRKFSTSHEWATIENNVATVGISAYAQKELGDIVFIELPKVGASLKQKARFGTIESTKTASEIFSPVSGEVVEVNTALNNNPQWVNEDPHGLGWLMKVKLDNPNELQALMTEAVYQEFIAKEAH